MLTAAATATAAILTGTTHSQKALSIVAAAFGMTTALNDAIFQSFLFTESPGLIAIKIKQLQDAYKQTVENDPRNNVYSSASAYSAIQNYYNICLPESIEGTLLQAVADTTAKTTDPGKARTPANGQLSNNQNATVHLAPAAPTTTPNSGNQKPAPAGPQGPQGPAGPTGPAGPAATQETDAEIAAILKSYADTGSVQKGNLAGLLQIPTIRNLPEIKNASPSPTIDDVLNKADFAAVRKQILGIERRTKVIP